MSDLSFQTVFGRVQAAESESLRSETWLATNQKHLRHVSSQDVGDDRYDTVICLFFALSRDISWRFYLHVKPCPHWVKSRMQLSLPSPPSQDDLGGYCATHSASLSVWGLIERSAVQELNFPRVNTEFSWVMFVCEQPLSRGVGYSPSGPMCSVNRNWLQNFTVNTWVHRNIFWFQMSLDVYRSYLC